MNYGEAKKKFSPHLNSLHVSWASADTEVGSRVNLRTLAMTKFKTEIKNK